MWAVAAQPRVGLTPIIPTPSFDGADVTRTSLSLDCPGGVDPLTVLLGMECDDWEVRGQATASLLAAMAWTANSIRAVLPTRSPPDSRATFQVRPKSSRLTSVAALKPTRSSPMGEAPPPSKSTCRVMGLVVPCTVRSPASSQVLSRSGFTAVDAKVIAG